MKLMDPTALTHLKFSELWALKEILGFCENTDRSSLFIGLYKWILGIVLQLRNLRCIFKVLPR